MSTTTRKIGLSLGADICWPICYEALLKQLDPVVTEGDGALRFEVERVHIEPFDLRQPCPYDVVIDRLTHWYHTSREWIKKSIVMDDLYVFNNPWTLQSMEKQTTYCAMMRLGFPVPDTWLLPPKSYTESSDLESTLSQYAKLFDLGEIGDRIGYPLYMKPYDGGAWVGVTAIHDKQSLIEAYNESGTRVMHLQKGVVPNDAFVRCIGLGPQRRCVNYDPSAPLHDRYRMEQDFLAAEDQAYLHQLTGIINAFFGWDFNSCEALRRGGVWHPIDFANACPDSQVTSLHYHFPWLVKSNIRWSVFCAATRRKVRANLNWHEYFAIADSDRSQQEKMSAYHELAEAHFETARFEAFCEEHLADLDAVAEDLFRSGVVRDAIRKKVSALYPEHEVDEFTELFWQRVQQSLADDQAAA